MRFAVLIVACVVAGTASATVRNDSVYDKISGAQMAAAMEAAGLPATLTKDKAGDPLIRSKYFGWGFVVVFEDCGEKHEECGRIAFSFGMDLPNGTTPGKINSWNEKYVTQAFLDDENDPFIEWTVLLDGGITDEALANCIDLWKGAVEDATDYFSDEGA